MNTLHVYQVEKQEPNNFSARILKKVERDVLSYKPKRVLDIGCGTGALCGSLVQAGVETVGCDPTLETIEFATKQYPGATFKGISIYDAVEKITPSLGLFDVIVSTEVIEHLYLPHILIQFAKKHLSPNGVLILSTPDYGSYIRNLAISLCGRWDHHFAPLWQGGHVKFWSKKTVKDLLYSEGFKPIRWDGVRSKRMPIWNISLICHSRISE